MFLLQKCLTISDASEQAGSEEDAWRRYQKAFHQRENSEKKIRTTASRAKEEKAERIRAMKEKLPLSLQSYQLVTVVAFFILYLIRNI